MGGTHILPLLAYVMQTDRLCVVPTSFFWQCVVFMGFVRSIVGFPQQKHEPIPKFCGLIESQICHGEPHLQHVTLLCHWEGVGICNHRFCWQTMVSVLAVPVKQNLRTAIQKESSFHRADHRSSTSDFAGAPIPLNLWLDCLLSVVPNPLVTSCEVHPHPHDLSLALTSATAT